MSFDSAGRVDWRSRIHRMAEAAYRDAPWPDTLPGSRDSRIYRRIAEDGKRALFYVMGYHAIRHYYEVPDWDLTTIENARMGYYEVTPGSAEPPVFVSIVVDEPEVQDAERRLLRPPGG